MTAGLGIVRDRDGRFAHRWGWQGFDASGREWSMCEHCEKWRSSDGVTRRRPPAELRASPAEWER